MPFRINRFPDGETIERLVSQPPWQLAIRHQANLSAFAPKGLICKELEATGRQWNFLSKGSAGGPSNFAGFLCSGSRSKHRCLMPSRNHDSPMLYSQSATFSRFVTPYPSASSTRLISFQTGLYLSSHASRMSSIEHRHNESVSGVPSRVSTSRVANVKSKPAMGVLHREA